MDPIYKSALFQVMTLHWTWDKALLEPVITEIADAYNKQTELVLMVPCYALVFVEMNVDV